MQSNSQKPHISSKQLDEQYLSLSRDWSLWDIAIDDALQKILKTLTETLTVSHASIRLCNEEKTKLTLLQHYGIHSGSAIIQEPLERQAYPEYFAHMCTNHSLIVNDVHNKNSLKTAQNNYFEAREIESLIHVFLENPGLFSGVLSIENEQKQEDWNEDEIRFIFSIADLIAHRLTHEELQKSEASYKKLFSQHESSFDGANYSIISTELDGTIRTFNKAACKMLGYSQEEVVGKLTPAVIHDPVEVVQRAQELSKEEGTTIEPGFEVFVYKAHLGISEEREWTYIHKDGHHIPVLLSITALRDAHGEINGFLGIAIDITDRVLTSRALREQEATYRLLYEASADSILLMNESHFIDCNPATLQMFGCKREQIIGETPYRFFPEYQPDGRTSEDKAKQKIYAALNGDSQLFEWQHLRYDGTPIETEVSLNTFSVDSEVFVLATVRDISLRKQAEIDLENSRKQLVEHNHNLTLINELSSKLHGRSSLDIIVSETLKTMIDFTHTSNVAFYLLDESRNKLILQAAEGLNETTILASKELPLKNSLSGLAIEQHALLTSSDITSDDRLNSEIKYHLINEGFQSAIVIPLFFNNEALGCLNIIFKTFKTFSNSEKDVFETVGQTLSLALANAQNMNALKFMAHHDSLTGLSNRSVLHQDFLKKIIDEKSPNATMMLFDLDRFKEINDTLGHYIGDKLLQKIGPRIQSIMSNYKYLLCRLGGDEFTLLIYSALTEEELKKLSQQLLHSLRQPFEVDSMILEIDASFGLAIYPVDGADSHALLRSADVAMYDAKTHRKGISFYNPEVDNHSPERLTLLSELSNAIKERQLILHYQPKLNIKTNQVAGFEALVRWNHPKRGLLFPDSFIPLAEVSEVIHPLTEALLKLALEQQQDWLSQGKNYTVSVNMSARNLMDDRFLSTLKDCLAIYETDPALLELEITETTLMQDPERAIAILEKIASMGVKLSVDDFGTGYSSLAYLRKLPLDALKIDRVFVNEMLASDQDEIIVSSTIGLAHNLKLTVIAEGVEDQKSLDALKKMDCDSIQGYFISRPKAWIDIQTWLYENNY